MAPRTTLIAICVFALMSLDVQSWQVAPPLASSARTSRRMRPNRSSALCLFETKDSPSNTTPTTTTTKKPSAESTTEKYGLEAGLFRALKSNDDDDNSNRVENAKSLLAKYGVAYLATSIPLAALSFALCYLLVDHGVDVGGLLAKVGIQTSGGGTGEKVGTLAIAYAAHKAASPIRFPPTVILTPIVARLIGKEPATIHNQELSPDEQEE